MFPGIVSGRKNEVILSTPSKKCTPEFPGGQAVKGPALSRLCLGSLLWLWWRFSPWPRLQHATGTDKKKKKKKCISKERGYKRSFSSSSVFDLVCGYSGVSLYNNAWTYTLIICVIFSLRVNKMYFRRFFLWFRYPLTTTANVTLIISWSHWGDKETLLKKYFFVRHLEEAAMSTSSSWLSFPRFLLKRMLWPALPFPLSQSTPIN